MSRAVWRAASGTLRANWRLPYYYINATLFTAYSCGLAFGRHAVVPILLVAFWIAFGWPLSLSAPTHRELLRLPLSTRGVGTVFFMLRVLAPCVCVIVLTPLVAPFFSRTPVSPREWLPLACGLCAAFPLMSFTPFLPLPLSWRLSAGGLPEGCDAPGLRWAAAAALWVVAPAIAVIPLVSTRVGFPEWPWLSLVLGLGLALCVWTQREWLARRASQRAPNFARGPAREHGARWRGFVHLLAPLAGRSCMLGVGIGLFFTVPLPAATATAVGITLVALSASLNAGYIASCARVLRLLPIDPAHVAAMLLAMLLLPTLAGCLLGATLAHALHPARLTIAHAELLCLLSLTCNIVLFVPVLRSAHRRFMGPLFAASALLQFGLVLALPHFGIAVPRDGWLFAACLGLLVACLAQLTRSLKFNRLQAITAVAFALLAYLPVVVSDSFTVTGTAPEAVRICLGGPAG